MELTPFFFGLYKFVKYGLYPLTWVILLLTLTTGVLLLPAHPSRLRWGRIGAAGSLALLLLISSPIVSSQLIGILESWHPPIQASDTGRYDAIVVLGGGTLNRGSLRPSVQLTSYSRDRTTCGVDLYHQGYAPRLVLTGGDGNVFGSGPKEAVEMKRWAERLGVPREAIVTEIDARTTYENATGTKRLLGPSAILLVSSATHMPRATALFAKQGFRVTPAPCDFIGQDQPGDALHHLNLFDLLPNDRAIQSTREFVSEVAGMIVYWVSGKL